MRRILLAPRGGIGIVLATLLVTTFAAHAQPTIDANLIRKRGTITQEEDARIASYVSYWGQRLTPPLEAGDRLSQIQDATQRLGRMILNDPGITPTFRDAYSRRLLPELSRLVESADEAAAIRAMYLSAKLSTNAGLNLILSQIDSESGVRRNAAAAAAKVAIRDMMRNDTQQIAAATIATLLRTVGDSVGPETDAAALQRQLELLDQIHTTAQALPRELPNLTEPAQDHRIAALDARAEKLDSNIVEIDAIDMFVRGLRATFLAQVNTQQADGPRLVPSLTAILQSALRHAQAADGASAQRKAAYSRLIADTENFLKLIDRAIQPTANPPTPDTQLRELWDRNDIPGYQRDLQKWENLMQVRYGS